LLGQILSRHKTTWSSGHSELAEVARIDRAAQEYVNICK